MNIEFPTCLAYYNFYTDVSTIRWRIGVVRYPDTLLFYLLTPYVIGARPLQYRKGERSDREVELYGSIEYVRNEREFGRNDREYGRNEREYGRNECEFNVSLIVW